MSEPLPQAGIAPVRVAGHLVHSLSALGESDSQTRKSYADLTAALPSQQACEAVEMAFRTIITTPDFHPGKPVPVGVVADVEGGALPHLVGNDIGCGMRMLVVEGTTSTDLPPTLEKHLRHIFFQGGRDVTLTGNNRTALLREGLPGLFESFSAGRKGLLEKIDIKACWRDLDRTCDAGVFQSDGIDPDFEHYATLDDHFRHDAILGTIGGGNHFIEVGTADMVVDGAFANAIGISRSALVVVVHSGSLDFGQRIGSVIRERLEKNKSQRLDHRLLSRGADPALYKRFVTGHANAVNAAFVNRFFLGVQTVEALSRAVGRELTFKTVYDAPHNAIWFDEKNNIARHRKGACPARGPGDEATGLWIGEPVILPGSMGDGSWLLAGKGNPAMLHSSAHGAGRKLSRQEARKQPAAFDRLRVVGPVDLEDPKIKSRPDILGEAIGRLSEEAPAAYRPIDHVVDAMCAADMVSKAVRIRPLVTVKG